MYNTVVILILLLPWSILGIMVVGSLGHRMRLRKVAIRSR
jgi:hypothetical protein